MTVTLVTLYENAETLYGMQLLAGHKGTGNVVRWACLVEDIKALQSLRGDELIFATGLAHTCEENWLVDFVEIILEKKISGLVLSIGSYIKGIPQNIINSCEEHNLPLYAVPSSVPVLDIMYDFCHKIIVGNKIESSLGAAFRNLIFSPNDEDSYRFVLQRHCFSDNSFYRIIVFEPKLSEAGMEQNEEFQNMLRITAQKILVNLNNSDTESFGLFFRDDRLIAVIRDFGKEQAKIFVSILQRTMENQKIGCELIAGMSPDGIGYRFVSDAYHKAILALDVAKRKNFSCLDYRDIGVYKLLVAVPDKTVLRGFYEETLGVLEHFDSRNGTDYMQTLRYYLEYDSSVQATAKLTFVHRNTVNYKIKKIREMLGCKFDAENKLKLMLAFLIKDIL